MFKPLTLIGTLPAIFLSSCAYYTLPAARLETPEACGENRLGRVELLGVHSAPAISSAAEDGGINQESGLELPDVVSNGFPTITTGLTLAPLPSLDVGVRFAPYSPLTLRAKYQLVGEPESTAVAGNFSLSGAVGIGLLMGEMLSLEAVPTNTTFFSLDLSLPLGYRVWDRHLFYLAPFFAMGSISAINVAANQYGAGLGYQYSVKSFFMRLELTYATGTRSSPLAQDLISLFFPALMTGLLL